MLPRISPRKKTLVQQILDQAAEKQDTQQRAHADGEQIDHRIFKVAPQIGHRPDQLVVDAHYNRHCASADAGDDVGDAHHQPLEHAG